MLNTLIRLASKVSRDKAGGNKAAMLHSSLLAGKNPSQILSLQPKQCRC